MRLTGFGLLVLLAGCAAEAAKPPPVASLPPPAANAVRLSAPLSIARERVERLAASCWLDAELDAELMVVDRRNGSIVAAGADGELLRIAFAEAGPLDTDVALTGTALTDPARAARMRSSLTRALEGEEPAC